MQELVQAIPDPEVVLALEPEELGAKLLFLLKGRHDRDHFSPDNMWHELQNMWAYGEPQQGPYQDVSKCRKVPAVLGSAHEFYG